MKKLCTVLLVLGLVLSSIFANNILQVGPSFTWNKPVVQFDELPEDMKDFDINNLMFGADVRLNMGFFQLATQAGIGGAFGDASAVSFNTNATANLRFAPAFFEIFIGAGVNMDFMYFKDAKQWTLNGQTFDNAGDAFARSSLIYRAGLGLNMGFLGLNVQAIIPTQGTFKENFSMMPLWENTKVTASVLFNFF